MITRRNGMDIDSIRRWASERFSRKSLTAGSVKDALDTIWNELERISTEESHTATNIEARKNLKYLEWFFENRPNANHEAEEPKERL